MRKRKDLIKGKNLGMKIAKIEEISKFLSIAFLMALALFLTLNLTSSDNLVPTNFSVTENVSRPDEWSQWEDIQEIKNQSNRSLPIITIGGVDTLYGEGNNIAIFASITLHGNPIDTQSYCNVTITQWNGSALIFHLNSTNMTKIFIGWYYLNWTIPTGLQAQGTYGILVEANPNGMRTQATAGFKVGFNINATINVDTSAIEEQMDCDGIADSPVCGYTRNLNNITAIIQDMLNCSNQGNQSDLCNYTDEIESKLDNLNANLLSVNLTLWNKLLTIETATNTIISYVDNISEALDCDTSTNDVCKKINDLRTVVDEINLTTYKVLGNVTWMLPQISDILSNVTDVKSYVITLINEFNCTSVNPSDVCYRLQLIENYSILIDTKVSEINRTMTMITIGGVNTLYGEGDTVTVYALLTLRGEPINPTSYINLTIIHLNGSTIIYDLNSTNMTKIFNGWYYYSWPIPSNAEHGSYGILIEADLLGKKIQATSGFKVGFKLNVSVTVDVSAITEQLDCDGIADSPICDFTDGLQSSIDKVQDMLNCSNLGNNSDLCNYAERIEQNLSLLTAMLISHNNTMWDKLLTIETVLNTINTNTDSLEESLDCDNSTNDVCKKIQDIEILVLMINFTTIATLNNVTLMSSQYSGLLGNISTIRDYVENLILEFNCSAINPSDVCYRLSLIYNATGSGPLLDILNEINRTTHETLTTVNYINEVRWGNFSYTRPIPTVLILQGKIKSKATGQPIAIGSLQVNITDAYLPTIIWSHEYNDVIKDGIFNLLLGGDYDLSLIPKRKYKRSISICEGITFDPNLYICETFTTYFIA